MLKHVFFLCILFTSSSIYTQRLSDLSEPPPLFVPVGYGSKVTGGSGGRIIKVTSLADSGSGTFRSACEASGARIVVFEVSGSIILLRGLTINHGDITIAGQTAPGDGITLVNGPKNDEPTLKIKAENVIVQYLKIRTGDAMAKATKLASQRDINVDAIAVTTGGEQVVLDHLSLSWSIDETVQLWSAKNVSLQNSILSESLTFNQHPRTVNNPKQAHGCTILVGQKKGEQGGNVTIYQNLMAHNSRRNPRLSCELPVEVINNVMYNTGGAPWGIHQPIVLDDNEAFAGSYDLVNNYFKPGPSTGSTVKNYPGQPRHFIGNLRVDNPVTRIYAAGNRVPVGTAELSGELSDYVVKEPTSTTRVPTASARDAYDRVTADAGDCWRLNRDGSRTYRRDELDARWVDDVIHGQGSWVDAPRRLPPHTAGKANPDADGDGMPDDYEDRFDFLNKGDASDGPSDEDGDGVTNVEEFLFGMSPGSTSTNKPSCTNDIASGTYQLLARHSGRALAVDMNPSTNGGFSDTRSAGANIFQYGTNTAGNRLWNITPVAGGYYKLTSVHSGKALSIDLSEETNGGYRDATADGVNVFQYGTDDRSNRLWKFGVVDGCYYTLTNQYSNKVLDVAEVSKADGANVHQWRYKAGRNQQWKLVPGKSARTTAAALQARADQSVLPTDFDIYPNPARGQLMVEAALEFHFALYDATGGSLLDGRREAGTSVLDITPLKPGIYFLHLRDSAFHEVYRRVVVH